MDEDIEWIENMASMEFHPCDTPRGMLYYNMDILTKGQQRKLNKLKIKTLIENQKYLAHHPQIQACVSLITRHVLKQRPTRNIHETIAEYFAKSKLDIEADVNEYLKTYKPDTYEARSQLDMFGNRSQMSSSETSSDTIYTTSSTRSSSQEEVTSIWKLDIPDLDRETVQMNAASLMNMPVGYELMGTTGIPTPMASTSISTEATDEAEEEEDETEPKTSGKPHHITINEYLKELESMSYLDMQEDEMVFIPRLEDYDGGYERRRQTLEDSQISIDESDAPIAEYLSKISDTTEEEEEDKHEEVLDFSVTSSTYLETTTSEMKPLMSRRSVRSSVAEDDIKRLGISVEETRKSKRKSKEERRSPEERERRSRMNADRQSKTGSEDRGSRQRARVEKTAEQLNKLHLDQGASKEEVKEDSEVLESANQLSTTSAHREELVTRKNTYQNIIINASKAIRVSLPEEHETEGKRQSTTRSVREERPGSISEYEASGSIESTIRHQFDTTFKSVGHMRAEDAYSKSNMYFKSENRNIGSIASVGTIDSGHNRSRLEQKVSFCVGGGIVGEEKNIPSE